MRRLRRGFGLFTAVVATLLATTTAELALRATQFGFLNAPTVSDPVVHHVHPRDYFFRSYDPGGEFGGHLIRYDGEGRRVDLSATGAAGGPEVRLALMGDSFVEAVQVPYEQSIAGLLQEAMSGRAVVRNYGVTGYSPILYYLQWKKQVRSWRPTHVLVLLYSNDIDDDRDYGALAAYDMHGLPLMVPGPRDNGLALRLHHSYVARLGALVFRRIAWAWQHRGQRHTPAVGGYLEPNPDISPLSSRLLMALAEEVRRTGATFTIATVPSKARLAAVAGANDGPEFSDKCRVWAAAHGIGFIDLAPAFREAAGLGRRLFFTRDIHLTGDGNAVGATIICHAYPDFCG